VKEPATPANYQEGPWFYKRQDKYYREGTPGLEDSQAELLLHGYRTQNGQNFPVLAQSQVAFGVPATSNAADVASFMSPAKVLATAKILDAGTSASGSYPLAGGSYPGFAGVMTWDFDYDQNNGLALSNALTPYLHSLNGTSSNAPIGHTIAIKASATGLFTTANLNTSADTLLAAWASTPQAWEQFTVVSAGTNLVALKSVASGFYVSCDMNNGDDLRAGWATSVQGWEDFTYQLLN